MSFISRILADGKKAPPVYYKDVVCWGCGAKFSAPLYARSGAYRRGFNPNIRRKEAACPKCRARMPLKVCG